MKMKIIKVTPRGYCKGVVRAINIVKEARRTYSGPIYILGQIVHNSFVEAALEEYHIITLDTSTKSKESYLNEITEGVIIFTAHGVSKKIYEAANKPNVTYIDASCLDVLKTQQLIKEKHDAGYTILYIGKKNHPESDAVITSFENIHLIQNKSDVDLLPQIATPIYVTNQTTMSIYDTNEIITYITSIYPNAEYDLEICDATKIRQEAIHSIHADALLVVGDRKSNNSNKLLELNTTIPKRYLINSVEDIDPRWFNSSDIIAITSGASTPTYLTNQVISYMEQLDLNDELTFTKPSVDIKSIL